MILVSDVDLDLQSELHTYGGVRDLKDRRKDVYDLRLINEDEDVKKSVNAAKKDR